MKLTLIISSNCPACERAKTVLNSVGLSHPNILTEFIDVNSYKKKNIVITPALLIDDILFHYGDINENYLQQKINSRIDFKSE